MAMHIEGLAAAAATVLLATSAFAQNVGQPAGPAPFVNAIENEPPPKLTVEQPLPDDLARDVVFIPYKVENLRLLPILGTDALKLSPRVGHLHITVDGQPWHWADFGGANTIAVVGLPPGPHKVLVQLSSADHHVFTGQTVTFTIPGTVAQSH